MVDGIDTTANDIRIYKHGPVVAGVLTAGKDNDPVAAARCASDAVRQTLLLSSAAVDDTVNFVLVSGPFPHDPHNIFRSFQVPFSIFSRVEGLFSSFHF